MSDPKKRARVFVNHAAVDEPIAELIVDALCHALRLPNHVVFCSSLEHHGIPTGADFVRHVRKQLDGTKVVVPLVTPAYLDSQFCMWELGAAWVKEIDVHPLVVDSIPFASLPILLSSRQVSRFDRGALDALAQKVASACAVTVDWPVWEDVRNRLLSQVESVLGECRQSWKSTGLAVVRRRARIGEAAVQIHRVQHELRDITHLIQKHGQHAQAQNEYWSLLRTIASNIADVFSLSTQTSCRVTIKQAVLIGGPAEVGDDPVMGVRDLTRSQLKIGDRQLVDLVDENTDFQVILNGVGSYYVCNDIPAAMSRGVYENSHTRPDGTLPYSSTAVWPIRKVLDDPEGTHQDLIGYLCVDAETVNTFDEIDIEIGSAFADSLYVLRPTIPMLDD